MPDTLTTTVTELPESRVRVEVQVPASEIDTRLQSAARKLGGELRLPGFRRGKIPAPLVIQRVGRDTVLEQAVRDTLARWYSDAIDEAKIVPVGDPDIDLGDLPAEGESLSFSIEIGVLPKAKLGRYKGLEVPRAEVNVPEEQIDEEIERLRDRLAKLESADRAAAQGDFVVIDYRGSLRTENELEPFDGGEGRDQLIELGSGSLIPGFEEQLVGASTGDERTVDVAFPDDYSASHLAGRDAVFEVQVRDVKAKQLPELDDSFAVDLGFDTLQELRSDISERLARAQEQRIRGEFREAALDAALAEAEVQVPESLVQARAREMWERTLHTLSHQGISRDTYLKISGRDEEQLLAEIAPDAERALRREALITAVVAAERINPSEEDLLEALTATAEREGRSPEKLLAELRKRGRLEDLHEDLAARQAIDLIAENATPIAPEKAQAREKLWTPRKDSEEESAGKLWTPES